MTAPTLVPHAFIEAAAHAADVAGAVIRPFFRAALTAHTKGDDSPVTMADRAAEQAMRAVLRERLPEHGILGEEFGIERPEARHRWVLDPIDGTRAFITGRPVFGTLLALLEDGVPVLGVIDQPVTGERWIGAAGRATTFTGPTSTSMTALAAAITGGTPRCRPCPALAEAELSATAPEMFAEAEWPRFRALQAATKRTTWGGDCYSYGLVALGGIDVVAESGLKTWDWAAVVPVIEGAGGRVTGWDGAPLRDGDTRVLALGNPALLPDAVRLLAAEPAR